VADPHSVSSERGIHMRSKCQVLFATALVGILSCATTAVATEPVDHAATWRAHDLIVGFHDLPHSYSCDDLWYKFRDVLLALGARPDMKILVYHCGPGQADARSPSVHLQFSAPELLNASQVKWTELDVTPTIVRLTPGYPGSLQSQDCDLLQQMKESLLPAIFQRLVSSDLDCTAPKSGRGPFSITVVALTSPAPNSGVVARTGVHSKQRF
jgi:hypothetical protein